jgi:hypothetical protein
VLVCVPADFFVDRFRDIESYKNGAAILEVKKFSDPPKKEDLRQLTIDKDDLADLRNCKVGDCGVRLPSSVILRVQKEIDWSSADAEQKATELARTPCSNTSNGISREPTRQLSQYSDKKQICANHYFEASLGLTVVVPATQGPDPSFYLLYFNRSRSDALNGGFSGLARGKSKTGPARAPWRIS